jgi:uncharacterized protein YbjT (DUF2867 family)
MATKPKEHDMNRGPNSTAGPILVVGGTGKTGRRVVDRLLARDVPVRIGSRSGATRFDWEDSSTWLPALRGASAAYITYYPDIAVPGASAAIEAFAALAVRHGVQRLVLLSGRGEEEAQHAEQILQRWTSRWTIVRASWMCQNFDEGAFLELVRSGEIALPAGDVPEPFVDADDIADVAAAALLGDGHEGRVYEVTGPRMLTFAQAIAEIGQACGRDLRYVPVTIDAFVQAAYQDMPDDVAAFLGYLFGEVLDGRNAHLTDGVQQALGRPPRDFADYARAAAGSGVWDVDVITELDQPLEEAAT